MGTKPRVLIRGGGDLASGVAARLHRAGFGVLVLELEHPLVVRRLVSFAEAVFSRVVDVEGVVGRLCANLEQVGDALVKGEVAVMVDPDLTSLDGFSPLVLVDARMRKRSPETGQNAAALVIGLGPGFVAGDNCHAVIETMRGHSLGRVIWQGEAQPNTGVPELVDGKAAERVVRAPVDGVWQTKVEIGDLVNEGDTLGYVGEDFVCAPFPGVVRGLVKEGLLVRKGLKIGDLDPRNQPEYARLISDKALAIAGGVLEAILSQEQLRKRVYAPD